MDNLEFERFINYIKKNKQFIDLNDLENEFKILIKKYDLKDDLSLIIQIIEIDEDLTIETLIEIILNMKNKVVKNILIKDKTSIFDYISNFINNNFKIEFLPKQISIKGINHDNINIKNELNKTLIINFRDYNDDIENMNCEDYILINSNPKGLLLKGGVNIFILNSNIFYNNIEFNYFGDVKINLNYKSLYFNISDNNIIKDIVYNFRDELDKNYNNDFDLFIYNSKFYLYIDLLIPYLKEFCLQYKDYLEYNNKNNKRVIDLDYENEDYDYYIINKKSRIKTNPIIQRCEHTIKLNQFINEKNPNPSALYDFLNDQIIIQDSFIFCKWCNEKIENLDIGEIEDDKLIIVNYELFKMEPYVNYINLKLYLESFFYNFLSVFEIDFYDYITLLTISIINWLSLLSINRLRYESQYTNDIKNNYIFFSRLTTDFFSFNLREDITYYNKRYLFTNLYLIYLLFLQLSLNDFWSFLIDNYKRKYKDYKDFICNIFIIYINKTNLEIPEDVNIKVFLNRFYDIIVEINLESIKELYNNRIKDYDRITYNINNSTIKEYIKNIIIKNNQHLDQNLYDINIDTSKEFLSEYRTPLKIIMNQKASKKDTTEYIYIDIDTSYYESSDFLDLKRYYNDLSFYYKYKNKLYLVNVERIDSQYCIYEKSNNDKKLFIMYTDPKYLNLTYKSNMILSQLFIFININNKLIFLNNYSIEESVFLINTFLFNIELIINKKIIINNLNYPLKLEDMLNTYLNIIYKLNTLNYLDIKKLNVYIDKLNYIFAKND